MDALLAKADAIQPLAKKRKFNHKDSPSPSKPSTSTANLTETSIGVRTKLPKSLRPSSPPPDGARAYAHIKDHKLRTQLARQSAASARGRALVKDAELLLAEDAGGMVVESEMERTWRVGQGEIVEGAGAEAARGRKEFVLDGGPYVARYSRNGRHLAIAGRRGHVSTFDWQTGALHSELQLGETCRDITFLHDQSHFAVAQKKYVFIYDKNGVELHRLANHVEPTRLEFLPYHWLLASIGNPGYLKYQDTSTGQLVIEHRTKLGATATMTQNRHSAVIYLGHQNGTVTLWTPNLPHPAVRLLAHLGPVASVSVDPSSGGRYMATAGADGRVKVWDCRNWKGAVREWGARAGQGQAVVEWSARGYLGVAAGGTVNVYGPPNIQNPHPAKVAPPLYITHPIPHRPISALRFCPFQDILTAGHAAGLSSILVPGAGEPNFDSTEADPFENTKARREREVKGLLDKIQPDLIALDPDFVGSLAPEPKLSTAVSGPHNLPFARLPRLERLRVQGKADETEDGEEGAGDGEGDGADGDGGGDGERPAKRVSKEEKERKKMRGKSKSMKRYLRKQRKNVIDPTALAVRKKLERQKEERARERAAAANGGVVEAQKPSALDRFKRTASR